MNYFGRITLMFTHHKRKRPLWLVTTGEFRQKCRNHTWGRGLGERGDEKSSPFFHPARTWEGLLHPRRARKHHTANTGDRYQPRTLVFNGRLSRPGSRN